MERLTASTHRLLSPDVPLDPSRRTGTIPPADTHIAEPTDDPSLALLWLIRLRWLALAAFLALPFGSTVGVRDGSGRLVFMGLISAMALTNLALAHVMRSRHASRRDLVGAVLVLDVALLTALLRLSGGAVNPGTVVYLVHVTFAAVLLGAGWAWTVCALSVAAYGALFLPPIAGSHLAHAHGSEPFASHLIGMWVAFAATAALIAYVVSHVSGALENREREVTGLRARAARHERLAALTTLAAGAAHELATPLSTIAVIARDIGSTPGGQPCPAGNACRDDAALITQEIARCHRVLDSLSGRAAGRSSAARPLHLATALDAARAELSETDAARVIVSSSSRDTCPDLPHDDIVSVIVALLRNALDASTDAARITLSATVSDGALRLVVRDEGSGMTPDVLARAGEPFFSTKAPGHGLGLGLFLARSLAEDLGGQMMITSHPGQGTSVTLVLPAAHTLAASR